MFEIYSCSSKLIELPMPKDKKNVILHIIEWRYGQENEIHLREGQRDLIHLEENN